MYRFSRILLLLIIVSSAILGTACSQNNWLKCSRAPEASDNSAHNVVLMIGDGMGPIHVTGGRLYQGGSENQLVMESMAVSGFSRTYSSSHFVTDSAAGATALASGVKTYNGSIGKTDAKVDPSGKSRDLQQLTDLALAQGKSVGIVTTAEVTHATPACFYAHVKQRRQGADIAAQVADSGLTVLIGGGRKFFYPPSWKDPEDGKSGARADGRNLVNEMKDWTYVDSTKGFNALDTKQPDLRVLALFQSSHMRYEADRNEDKLGEPSLADMTQKAIEILSQNPKGYFLMVEGARIDHASHGVNASKSLQDVIAFDAAIAQALKAGGENTLVVVTADHETGGLSISGKDAPEIHGEALTDLDHVTWGTDPGNGSYAAHSVVDVPVLANGPGQWAFTGYMNNADIAWKIAKAMGAEFTDKANLEGRK